MLSFVLAVVAAVGVGKLADAAFYGLGKLAGKTGTKVDDQVVAWLKEHKPDVVKLAEEALGLDSAKPVATPRPRVVDHRTP